MSRRLALAILISATTAPLCAQSSAPAPSAVLAGLLDDAYQQQLRTSLSMRITNGLPIERLPDASRQAWEAEAQFWARLNARTRVIRDSGLTPEERLSLRALRWESGMLAGKTPFYWVDFSFITPYASPLRELPRAFASVRIASAADTTAYLALLRQVARLAGLDAATREQLLRQVRSEITDRIAPAFTRLTDYLGGAYATRAPRRVGLGQYPGGLAYHRWLVRWHTTVDVTPEQVHRIGLAEVARINREMAAIRSEVGFTGTKAEFHASLRTDPRFFATRPEEFGERLMSYARRIEPKLSQFFGRMPKARGDVRRLAPELEPMMTFGYYDVPSATDSMGHYYYNGTSLSERSLLFAGSLISHELWPGHHFQINLARENTQLPPFRRDATYTAFLEGWGDYASIVAGEMGMYQDPWDRYGRLSMAMFIACRLVVDTGMNDFGWSRERAMQFMRGNALESETQIRSESLRYSTDIPGQALAYAMGSREFQRLRPETARALGPRFDVRAFHDLLLESGTLPMNVLAEKVRWYVAAHRPAGR